MRSMPSLLPGIVMALLMLPVSLQAEVPRIIGYQGKLTNSSGQPVTGNYDFKFKLISDGGSVLWGEQHLNTEVTNGLYSVLLGSGTLTDGVPLGSLSFDTQYWLSIEVEGEELSPRQPLSAAPYAIAAATASWVNNPYWLLLTTGGVCYSHTHPSAGGVIASSIAVNSVYPGAFQNVPYNLNRTTFTFYRMDASSVTAYAITSSWFSGNGGGLTGVTAASITDGSYQNIAVGTATIAKTLATGSYENIRAGTATVATRLTDGAGGSYQNIAVGTATVASTLATGSYENIRAGTATVSMYLASTTIVVGGYTELRGVTDADDSTDTVKGLGVMLLDFTGVRAVRISIFSAKTESFDQSWEFYDESSANAVGSAVTDTSVAGGIHTTTLTLDTGSSNWPSAGQTVVRLRTKNGTNTDPHNATFYGATILLLH